MRLVVLALALTCVSGQYYRLEPPSTYLKVESCRDIDEGTYGDPAGTCKEHGFDINCTSCYGAMLFKVNQPKTCDQATTKCHFRADDEKCVGASQCKYTEPIVTTTELA